MYLNLKKKKQQDTSLFALPSSVYHLVANSEFKLELQSGNPQFGWNLLIFMSCVTLKFAGWPWKIIEHLFYATSSIVHHLTAIGKSGWRYSPEMLNADQNRGFFGLCDLENWLMTLKNKMTPLQCHIKLCTLFYQHMWVKTGVTARKLLNWVLTAVILTFRMDIILINGN